MRSDLDIWVDRLLEWWINAMMALIAISSILYIAGLLTGSFVDGCHAPN